MGVDYYIDTVLKVYLNKTKNIKIKELKAHIEHISPQGCNLYDNNNLQDYIEKVKKYVSQVNAKMQEINETLEKIMKINEENEYLQEDSENESCRYYLYDREGHYYEDNNSESNNSDSEWEDRYRYKELKPIKIIYENGNFVKEKYKRKYKNYILGKYNTDYDYCNRSNYEINLEDVKKVEKYQSIQIRG